MSDGRGAVMRRNPCVPCLMGLNPAWLEPDDVGELTWIAKLLELTVPLPDKRQHVLRFSAPRAPDLFWSEEQRSAYAFPGLDLSLGVCRTPVGREVYERWTGGKEPSWCGRIDGLPRIQLSMTGRTSERRGAPDHVLYLSNKWDPYWVRYIHPFDPGNRVFVGPGNPPVAVIVRGPPLRLTRHGLEG